VVAGEQADGAHPAALFSRQLSNSPGIDAGDCPRTFERLQHDRVLRQSLFPLVGNRDQQTFR
jgi:hypothetical protein